jgi:hypothetical protein
MADVNDEEKQAVRRSRRGVLGPAIDGGKTAHGG